MITDQKFCTYVENYIDTVYRVAFSMLKDPHEADDITQDTFLKLYLTKCNFESDQHVKNWLIKVCVNACKNVFRRPWRFHEDIDAYARTLGFDTPEQTELFLAVNSLDAKYRIVIHLHYFEGYSIKEISEILSIPDNTVSTRLARARRKLKQLLTEV